MFKAWSTFWAARARKRREEKSRHSQHIEETFSERLASRSAAGKSKIDVGFTSEQTLNQDRENGERRPTFSRFLKLWKGLRNSKRRSANEDSGKSVVFTIPTEDVFPKTHTRQQTYHIGEEPGTQTHGIKTELCDVHQVTHDIIEDYDHELHQLDDDLEMRSEDDLDIVCENEITEVEVTTDIRRKTNNEIRSSESSQTLAGKANAPDRKTSDEKSLQNKEGKSFSKESDVDSGCGSSCHEMYASEPQITHAQLNVSSLVYCHAQRPEKVEAIEKDKGTSLESNVLERKTEFEWCEQLDLDNNSNEQCSQAGQKSQVVTDSFEDLIKLAKDGMSTLARKRVDRDNRKTVPDCFQDTKPVDTPSDAQSTNTDVKLQGRDASRNDSATQTCLDARKVDSRVKCASSTFLSSDGDNTNLRKTLRETSKENQSRTSMNSATCVVEIPTITIEPELVKNSLETSPKIFADIPCSQDEVSLDHEVYNDQCIQDHSQYKIDQTSTNADPAQLKQKAVTFDKQNDLSLKIEENFLNNSVAEKTNRPKSLVLPSTNEKTATDKTMYGLKVTSLETLNLPSRMEQTEHPDGRIRAFSASIRRKLSFRERSSDDMDIEKHAVDAGVSKTKKLKGFRSFRINKKKKTKTMKTEEISQSTGCLEGSGSTKYWSTFDKIFHENTGSAIFTDVPFTIPETSELTD